MPASFAGVGISARDHSARTEKKPVTFVGDLPGVLGAEITTEARLPDLPGAPDQFIFQVVVCCVRCFHRRPHGRFLAAPCSWPPVSESHR